MAVRAISVVSSVSIVLLFHWVGTAQATDKPEIFVQLGHTQQINSVAFAPDGRTLASGSKDKNVKLWDVASGRELRTLSGHAKSVRSVAFSPDGSLLASVSRDETVKLWDPASGGEVRTLSANSAVQSVAFSADGRMLASGHLDGTIRLWDVASGRELRTMTGHSELINAVTFSPDGRTLASASADKTLKLWDMTPDQDMLPSLLKQLAEKIKLWDVASGRELRTFSGHSDGVMSVVFSPDGGTLVSGSKDKNVKLWDVASARELRTLTGHSSAVDAVSFSPDGRTLASGSEDKNVKLWDVANGKELRTFSGHANSINAVTFSPDGHTLVGSVGDILKLWDVASGRELRAFGGGSGWVQSVAFSPDGRTLVSGNANRKGSRGSLTLWDVASGRELRTFSGHSDEVASVAFSTDGRVLGSGSADKTIKLWDVASGQELRTLTGHSSAVDAVSFSPDGRTLASGSEDKNVKLWDVANGKELRTFSGHSEGVASVAFSPDGRVLGSGSADKTIKLWDVAGANELRTLSGHVKSVDSIAFSPDGRALASGSLDKTVKLWDIGSGKELHTLKQSAQVYAVAFSPHGNTLVSGSRDKLIKLWDVASGRELRTLAGHLDVVRSVALSPDGRTLASGSFDTTTRLWDVASGKELASLISFGDRSALVITPEGYYDASSETAEEYINVRVGNQVFSIGAYREKFYRPDALKLALAGMSLKQFARIDQVKLAPRVELIDVPSTTSEGAIAIKVRLSDTGGGIGDVRLFLNGSAVVQQSVERAVQPSSSGGIVRTYNVGLVNGRNELKAVAFNAANSMQSNPAVAEVSASFKATRPSLYAVVVGIQDFKNPKLQLYSPIADARLFTDTLRKHAAPLFEKVDVQVLTTSLDTSRESLTKVLTDARKTVGPDDLFVFFVASHGTVEEGEYFLITSNVGSVSTAKLKTDAISQTQLKALLANIPATKKLIVIDTCNAGALGATLQVALVTRGMNDASAMKILGRAVGSTVLSASTSQQEAVEGYKGHGLFTYVIAEGLSGRADSDKDGFISTLELANYVDNEVPTLAEEVFKRAQYPTVSPSGQGFPLVKIK